VKRWRVQKRRCSLDATQMRHEAGLLNDINYGQRTENPRVGGSIPPLGTIVSSLNTNG
jgi:hypothetical protein